MTVEGGKLIVTYTDGKSVELDLPDMSADCKHEKAEKVVIEEHDAEHDGTYLYVCPDCGITRVEHGKEHVFESTVYPATCTEEGYTINECKYCGYTESDPTDIVPALEHDFDEGHYVVGEGLTICEDGGTTVRVCKRCGETETLHTEPTGHKSDRWEVATAPTTESTGLLKGTCANCGQYVSVSVPALSDKDYVYTVTDAKEYCADTGKAEYSMEKDGQTFRFEVTLNPTEHILGGKPASESANKDGSFDVTVEGVHEFPGEEATCADGGTNGKGWYLCEADDCGEMVYVDTHKAHNYEDYEVVKPATCTEAGEKKGYCTDCAAEVTEPIEPLGHNYEYELKKVGETFTLTGTCTVCDDVTEETGLTGVETEIVREATCSERGLVRYTYTDADTEETVTLEVETATIPHTLGGKSADEWENADGTYDTTVPGITEFKGEEATCGTEGKNGKGWYTCEECEEMVFVETHKPHNFEEYEEIPATCTTEGSRTGTCTDCGEETTEVIPMKPHSYEYELEEGAEEGEWTLVGTCSVCGDEDRKEGITDVEEKVVREATCYEEGLIRYTYKDLSSGKTVTLDEAIPMTAHTLNGKPISEYTDEQGRVPSDLEGVTEFKGDEATCGDPGTTGRGYFTCEAEGCKELVYVDTYKPHAYSTSTVTKAPTCTEDGERTFTCEDCDGTYTAVISATGHNRTVNVTKTPTDTETGVAEAVCSNAGCTEKTVNVTLPVLGSEDYVVEEVTEATCSKEGVVKYTYYDENSEVTVSFTITTEMTDHSAYVDGTTTVYEWTLDGVKYTGYICEECDKMIVLASEPVEEPGEEGGEVVETPDEGGESELPGDEPVIAPDDDAAISEAAR